ncbi:MAG TPA: hypothetical protein VGR35_17530 [Tepidisphaeraceae bacterium]|nr:hypothetical protein [Tepidisphaeraceae bacterium]
MPTAVGEDDRDDDDDDSVDEDPLESDQDPNDADDVGDFVPCPFCSRPVHEDADICPRCGNFIGSADAPPRRVPTLVWVGLILAGLCVLTWVFVR